MAKLFSGIFVAIGPVLAILRAGADGHLAPLVAMVSDASGSPINSMYFWMSGILSSFLDNAPTYLVFFNLAAGEAVHLMGPLAQTLLAISMGSVCSWGPIPISATRRTSWCAASPSSAA